VESLPDRLSKSKYGFVLLALAQNVFDMGNLKLSDTLNAIFGGRPARKPGPPEMER
jgi:hypothetical protein